MGGLLTEREWGSVRTMGNQGERAGLRGRRGLRTGHEWSWRSGNERGSVSRMGTQERRGAAAQGVTEAVPGSASAHPGLAPHLWLLPSPAQPAGWEPGTKPCGEGG